MKCRRREIRLPISRSSVNTLQLSLGMDAHRELDLYDRPKFKVVVVYEDGAAGRRAKHFYDKVIWELVDDCEFDLELWNFQVLAIQETRNFAARSAAQADLAILSMHAKTELPTQTRNWMVPAPGRL